MTEDVRALCKRRYGDGPCVRVFSSDYKTIVATHECTDWCAALQRRIEDEELTERSEP